MRRLTAQLCVLALVASALLFPAPVRAATVVVSDLGDQVLYAGSLFHPSTWDIEVIVTRNGVPVGAGAITQPLTSTLTLIPVPIATFAPFVLNTGDQLASNVRVRPTCGQPAQTYGMTAGYETAQAGGGTRLTATFNGAPTVLYWRIPQTMSPISGTSTGVARVGSGPHFPCDAFRTLNSSPSNSGLFVYTQP